jgi:hypothetical protein
VLSSELHPDSPGLGTLRAARQGVAAPRVHVPHVRAAPDAPGARNDRQPAPSVQNHRKLVRTFSPSGRHAYVHVVIPQVLEVPVQRHGPHFHQMPPGNFPSFCHHVPPVPNQLLPWGMLGHRLLYRLNAYRMHGWEGDGVGPGNIHEQRVVGINLYVYFYAESEDFYLDE